MLARFCKLSLREIEQLLASINLALRTAKDNEYIHPALLAFLVITKNFRPSLYQKYVKEPSAVSDLIGYLYEIVPEASRQENYQCATIEGFLIAAKRDPYSESEHAALAEHKKVAENANLSYKEKQYSSTVLRVVEWSVGFGHEINLDALAQRIDWLSQFNFPDNKG